MGWSHGKGLGANEDGQKDHVKVKLKQDALGVGADIRSIDNWMENTNALDDILKSLNKSGNVQTSADVTKQEEQGDKESFVSREEPNRVLFGRQLVRRKFIRNKNASNYDTQDMSMILGLRNQDTTEVPAVSARSTPDLASSSSNEVSTTNKLQVVKDDDVHSYFASKLDGKFTNSKLSYLKGTDSASPSTKTMISEHDDERPSFGMGFSMQNTSVTTAVAVEHIEEEKKKKSKDSKKRPIEETESNNVISKEDKKKKKKKSKK